MIFSGDNKKMGRDKKKGEGEKTPGATEREEKQKKRERDKIDKSREGVWHPVIPLFFHRFLPEAISR